MYIFILKAVIFALFAVLYIVNNSQMEWLARAIRNDILHPYTNQYEVVFTTPTPGVDTENGSENENEYETPSSTLYEQPVVVYITATPVQSTVTEEDLWEALIVYRHTHSKNSISKEESLCRYARSRADELYTRARETPQDPLDNHAGFIRDAESGAIFERTGYSYVGENLAFLPNTTTATQVIEWGWDSSASHRSLQLSDDITNGCIALKHPIYVGIYSY